MKKTKTSPCFLLVIFFGFVSCITTGNMGSIEVELMKPALFTLSKDIDTIAVFKRKLFNSNNIYSYINLENQYYDTTITHAILIQNLADKCVDGLADHLKKEGNFLKVINYRDSMNHLFTNNEYAVNRINDYTVNYPELVKNLKVDACIFLDYFQLNDHLTKNSKDSYNSSRFPEFKESTELERITANLFWIVELLSD